MLFKTFSAAVYGIDAYWVEVEVDVGSARRNDFNVVDLPDNTVKRKSRKNQVRCAQLRVEFPYGQGVTVNLAPADVKKEGSAFDFPWRSGLEAAWASFSVSPSAK
jgi:magnesium chelatase family protein